MHNNVGRFVSDSASVLVDAASDDQPAERNDLTGRSSDIEHARIII